MRDQHQRNIDYLRISIIDRCNLRCVYCMPEDGVTLIKHADILTYEEIIRICKVMVKFGLKYIKITGGEPLIRKDLPWLIAGLKAINGIEQVTLTTNGILLKDQLTQLVEAGIDAINISLDTLDPDCFNQITRRDAFKDVWEGILACLEYPQIPLKINCVPVDHRTDNLISMAKIAKDYPIHVRFIEMMPIGYGKDFNHISEDSIVEILEKQFGSLTPYYKHLGNGPCHYYTIEGFKGRIGFISAISHKFCDQCNRIRLTADGYLKTCLQYETGVDLKELLRSNCSDSFLGDTIYNIIYNKPLCHQFNLTEPEHKENRSMSQIGG